MMKLPSEVFNLILLQLVQRDKLECMTVCREWYEHINRHHSLFREIFIQHQRQLNDLIETVDRNPALGTRVERLTLYSEVNLYDDTTTFDKLFPNLRHFILSYTASLHYHIKSHIANQSSPWCKHIETILENSSYLHTELVLKSGLCPNLTFISVTGQSMQPLHDFVENLQNAPALKILKLNESQVSFDDLELLHKNVPRLETLLMEWMDLKPTPQPLDIKPATLLKRFQWFFLDFEAQNDKNSHLPYIFQKYTHLEDLAIKIGMPVNTDDDEAHDDEAHNELIAQHSKNIKSYLKTLGPGLKTLSLSIDVDVHSYNWVFDFNLLDECSCQVENLNFGTVIRLFDLQQLSNTIQIRYIQSLDINIKLGKYDQSGLMKCIRHFTALRKLNLSLRDSYHQSKRYELHLVDLLDALRELQLETLALGHSELQLNKTVKVPTCPFLKHLICSYVTFGNGTDVFISKTFPNLKNIELDNCFREGEKITLPQTNLMNLKILNTCCDHALQGLVITLDNNQKRLYTTNREHIRTSRDLYKGEKDIYSLVPVVSEPYNGSPNIPFVTIICKSVYDVSFLNARFYDIFYQL